MTSTARRPTIQCCGVQKWFGKFQALRDIDLTVAPNETVIICGPSGSGKSTLIRCMNRLEEPDAGTILLDGVEIGDSTDDATALRRQVGMVFQQFNLFPHLTVLENCVLGPMKARGFDTRAAEEVAMRFLTRVKVSDQARKYPRQLSGGQQQRVAIARALCMEPKVMLFDEPTSALDPEMIKEVLDVMADVSAAGMTMICVTHEMGFARQAADRVIFMDHGAIVETATPEQFFSAPETARARDFLDKILHH